MFISNTAYSILSPFGSIRFMRINLGTWGYKPKSDAEMEFLKDTSMYKSGKIWLDPPEPATGHHAMQPKREVSSAAPSDSASDKESERLAVKTAKQAYAWFVKWYGADPDRYRRSRVVSLAAEHEVEFPNMTGQ